MRSTAYTDRGALLTQRAPERFPAWSQDLRRPYPNFVHRILLLALLFTAELIALSVWLDDDSLAQNAALVGLMHDWGSWILRCIVAFIAIFLTFAYLRDKTAFTQMAETGANSIKWNLLGFHALMMTLFAGLSFLLYAQLAPTWSNSLVLAWLVAGLAAIFLAGLAFSPWAHWVQLVKGSRLLWLYSLLAAILACFVGNMGRALWHPASPLGRLTFALVAHLLRLFVSSIVADPSTMTLGTARFQVEIAPQCSGLEGAGLILAFGILWLVVFRRDYRFPRSLLLIPAGVAVMFALNIVRVAALILIGNAGFEQIAVGGFHSQAGWLAFGAVAVSFCLVVQHVPWFAKGLPETRSSAAIPVPVPAAGAANPTAAFLLPFATILAAGMIAGALTGGFEWFYPLRFFAAAAALWAFRRSYTHLNWSWSGWSIAVGVAVFAVWVGLDYLFRSGADPGIPKDLQPSTASGALWIIFRVLAAVITVPLAEELAFRGFLMRRLVSRNFDSLPFRDCGWLALGLSSVIFGFMHSGFRLSGTFAGMLFGLILIRRERFGEAVVAHATCNALLAAYVLTFHQWHLW